MANDKSALLVGCGCFVGIVLFLSFVSFIYVLVALSGDQKKPGQPIVHQGISRNLDELESQLSEIADIQSASLVDDELEIEFVVSDNLSSNLIKTGLKIDLTRMLQLISQSTMNYRTVSFAGNFPMVDKLGNVQNSQVVKVSFSASTVNSINFENFLYEDVFDISEDHWSHSEFQ